jgi:methylmalonyl-CoA/ethylmalonyl-CoA epimerase
MEKNMAEALDSPLLQDVEQIALTVQDLPRAKAFYRDALGMRFLFDAGSMAFFECGSVRLMIGQGEPSPGGTIIYFRVADINAAAQLLQSRGVEFVQQPHLVARMKTHDLWLAFVKDTSGNTLGLMCEMTRPNEKTED